MRSSARGQVREAVRACTTGEAILPRVAACAYRIKRTRTAHALTNLSIHPGQGSTRPGNPHGIRFIISPLIPRRRPHGLGQHNGGTLNKSSESRSVRAREWLRRIFAEKEIYFRSHGKVRFVRIGTRVQVTAATVTGALLLGWLIGSAAILVNQLAITHDRAAIEARALSVAIEARKVDSYKRSVHDVAEDLDRRQDMLDDMVRSQFGTPAVDPAVVGAPDAETAGGDTSADKLSDSTPGPAGVKGLQVIGQRQTLFARRLALLVNARAARAEAAIRSFGLNPAQIVGRARSAQARSAQGGPFVPWSRGDANDDAFGDLADALTRLNALEQGLVAIPSGRPTTSPMLSSSYGYRRDPFNGSAAFHAGIDFPGSYGQPILSAAAGRVAYVGTRQGYGNVVEIDHGNGIMTRYAHLSGFAVRPGQEVSRGVGIGRMGSTGRSTGTHLHFEVRVNGAAINPRRFLEVKEDVLKIQQIAKQRVARVSADGEDAKRG